jgi:hypothetical protein
MAFEDLYYTTLKICVKSFDCGRIAEKGYEASDFF